MRKPKKIDVVVIVFTLAIVMCGSHLIKAKRLDPAGAQYATYEPAAGYASR
jgi:hypothetical protein